MALAVCVMLISCFCCNINDIPLNSVPAGYATCTQECTNVDIDAIVEHSETLLVQLNDHVNWYFPNTKTPWEEYQNQGINDGETMELNFSPKLVRVNGKRKYSDDVVDIERLGCYMDTLALKQRLSRKKRQTSSGSKDKVLADGRDVILQCSTDDSIKSWYGYSQNGRYGRLSMGTDIVKILKTFKYSVDAVSDALTVTNVGKDDAGRYLCYSWGSNTVTAEVYLTWAEPQRCSVAGVLLYNEEDDIVLQCAVDYYGVKPGNEGALPVIVWYHDGDVVSEMNVSQHTRTNIRPGPILVEDVIVESTLSLSADFGMDGTRIECKYRLETESPEVQICTALIDVTPTPPTPLEYPSDHVIFPRDESSTSILLNCTVDPNDVKVLYHMWRGYTPRLESENSTSSRISINDRITSLVKDAYFLTDSYGLLIPQASIEDAGKYICSDFIRGDIASANIVALVPGICQSDATMQVATGTNYEIGCSTEVFGTIGSDLRPKLTIFQNGEILAETDISGVIADQMNVAVTKEAEIAFDGAVVTCSISIDGLLDPKELCRYTLAVQDKKQDNDSCLASPGLCLKSDDINLCDCSDATVPGKPDTCLPVEQCEMLDDLAWEAGPDPLCTSLEDAIYGECEDDDDDYFAVGAYNCTGFDTDIDDEPCIDSLEKVELACECLPGYVGDGISCQELSI